MRFFATAAKGTEPALRDELRELRLPGVRADRGGVHFEGDLPHAARACLWSRIAVRVLLEIASFDAPHERALYDGARGVDWREWVTPRTTVAVRASCRASRLAHSQFVAQKTKDAIVDAIRDGAGARPSVDRDDPDVAVAVRLARDAATLYLDMSGASLHERGWRAHAVSAPLRETLAAAILRLSGWNREDALVDPMCGSGTLAIEAAAWSRNVAPGLSRARFGFERWASHDDDMRRRMREMRERARTLVSPAGAEVIASDTDSAAVQATRENARAAGVEVEVRQGDACHVESPGPRATLVTNPPYGERIEATAGLYEGFARALRRARFGRVAILAGTPAIARAMGRPADRFWVLYNGPIECRLLVYAHSAESA
ncbi:MAG: THUMP domain-containing protein [Polyangiaceae bacterium]|nr:THUMP domain-containing protein [Polyangiaceae bacterium]